MGLSIHYSGYLRDKACLYDMIVEVKDVCESFRWEYQVYNDQYPDDKIVTDSDEIPLYGISFTPPNCETVFLAFLSNLRMTSFPNLIFYGKSMDSAEQKYLYMLSVKTQFAGIGIHQLIIHLFRYLDKKYFRDFEVHDEGQYWETGDEALLQKNFTLYTGLLNQVAFAIEDYPMNDDETFESYFSRLIELIRKDRDV